VYLEDHRVLRTRGRLTARAGPRPGASRRSLRPGTGSTARRSPSSGWETGGWT